MKNKPVHRGAVQQYRPTEGPQRRAVGTKAASFSDDTFLYLRRRGKKGNYPSVFCWVISHDFCDSFHLNKVGIESSQQDSFKQLLLVAALVAERRVTLTRVSMWHQLGFIEVRAELGDETCIKATSQNPCVKRVQIQGNDEV